jgi:hypothetical protein
MSACAISMREWCLALLRQHVSDVEASGLRPEAFAKVHGWLAEMHGAANAGDTANVYRLSAMVRAELVGVLAHG